MTILGERLSAHSLPRSQRGPEIDTIMIDRYLLTTVSLCRFMRH